jgi:hypothetical protein
MSLFAAEAAVGSRGILRFRLGPALALAEWQDGVVNLLLLHPSDASNSWSVEI